jgi:hypothetical protein
VAATAAGAVLVLGATAACGSNDAGGSPSSTTTEDFCNVNKQFDDKTTPQEAADKLKEIGTPSNMTDSERHGFEVLVDKLSQLPDDAKASDYDAMEQGISAGDKADVEAFIGYEAKTCMGVDMSDMPSMPSDGSS